jgi:hypothetical protein
MKKIERNNKVSEYRSRMIQANIDSRSAKIIMTNPFGVKSTVCLVTSPIVGYNPQPARSPCRAYMSDFIDLVTKQTVDLTNWASGGFIFLH